MVNTKTIDQIEREKLMKILEEAPMSETMILSKLELYNLLSRAYMAGQHDYFCATQHLLGADRP